MKRYEDDYEFDAEFEDELEDELEEEKEEKDKKNDKKNKKSKRKAARKNKTKTKKSRGGSQKKKVVHQNRDKNTHSGLFSFFLFIIIVALLAVIAYLIYVNYYEEDNTNNVTTTDNETEEMCEANTTKYTLASGLQKCSDNTQFKLNVVGTDLAFDISRTGNEELPYIINTVYYNDNPVSNTSITGISLSNEWDLKIDGDVVYLLITNPNSNILTVIDNGLGIYNDNSTTEYKLSSDVTYTRYTTLGLAEIDTCENYEANNQLESEMWTTGKLVYSNGTITAEDEEVITAADVCK